MKSLLFPSKESWKKAVLIWLACLINGRIMESVFSSLFPEPTPIAVIIVIGGGIYGLYYLLALEMQFLSWFSGSRNKGFSFTISPQYRKESICGLLYLLVSSLILSAFLSKTPIVSLLVPVLSAYLHQWKRPKTNP